MKKIFAYLLALCMVLGMLPATALAAEEPALPNAEVKSLGAITVKEKTDLEAGEYTFDESYYIYTGSLTDSTEAFDLQIAMEFIAKDTPEEAAANAYGNYTTDFFITMSGMSGESIAATGCYLAGYYPSFGAWVKIPLDAMTIENGKIYPVITSVGFDFKYVDICNSVQDFICGIYLSEEVKTANPNLKVTLDLGLSETAEKAVACEYTPVDSYTYAVDGTLCVAAIGNEGKTAYYTTLPAAIEDADPADPGDPGDTVTLLKDVTTAETINITKDVTIDGNGKTLTYTGVDRAIEVSYNENANINLTIENLIVDCTGSYCQRGINYNENGTLTLTNVTVKGTNVTYALNLPGKSTGATVDISGGSYTGCIALNIWGANSKVNVTNAALTSVDTATHENYAAISLNNDGTTSAEGAVVTVTGGSITALDENGDASIAVRNSTDTGTVSVSDTTKVNGISSVMVAIVDYGYPEFYSCFTLQDAITKATDDATATVKLLKGMTENVTVSGAVKLDLNGKTMTGTITLAEGAVLTAPDGLNVTTDYCDGSLPYYVTYSAGKYVLAPMHTISIDLNGGSYVDGVSNYKMYTGDKLDETQLNTAIEKITREGYTFKGWYDATEGGNEITTATVFNANGIIYAQWTKVDYTIAYNLDGGSVEGTNPTGYNVASDAITLINPTKEGYTFAGWTGTDLSEATTAVTIASGSTGNREYTATWTVNQYTVTWSVDGVNTVVDYAYGDTVTAPEAPTKTGYTFAGWDTEIPSTMPAENVTITAQWTVNQYTITFAGFEDMVFTSSTQEFGTPITVPADPTVPGYTFKGWHTEIPATMPDYDMTIIAVFKATDHLLTFKDWDGTVLKSEERNYLDGVGKPSDPTREGYTFTGWGADVPSVMPDHSLTFTAQYEINQYTITFMSRGSVYKTITQDYGTAIEVPTNPSRSGYTFKGWDTEIPSTMPAEDMTITAQWSKNYVAPTTTTETTKNEDGSTTTTVTNNKTGTTTETTENVDGSTTVTETKKDGTSTSTTTGSTTETGEDGSTTKTDSTVTESVAKDGTTTTTETKTETTEAADGSTTKTETATETKTATDGSVTTTETKSETTAAADGSTTTTETKAETVTATDGSVTATEEKTETTEAADGSTTKTETKAETVTATDGTETKTETKTETTQNADGTTSTATTETKTETKTEEDGSVVSTETKTETTENADGTTSTATTETKTTSATTTDETTGATVTETKVETKVESEKKTVTSTATETKTEAADGTTETVKVEETVEQTADTTTKTTATTTATEEKTETVAVKEETVTKEDGTTETKTTTTTETALADGTTGTATTDESGKTEAQVTLGEQAAASEEPVALPIPAVSATTESEAASTVTVTTNSTENTKVEIPVAEVSTSTVAVIVNEDGTETVITETKMTETGLVVAVPDGATVKIVDNATDFHDVEDHHWENDAIDFASSRGLVNGVGNNAFDKDGTATRAQVVTMLARMAGVDTNPTEGETWYDKAHEWAVASGITYEGNLNALVSRQSVFTMLWLMNGAPKSDHDISHFTDVDGLTKYTEPAARWAAEIGLLQGHGNGIMDPNGSVTRGQLAQFLMNYVQLT